jgi:hypothetical protein
MLKRNSLQMNGIKSSSMAGLCGRGPRLWLAQKQRNGNAQQ